MPTDVIIEPSSGQIYWNDSGGIGASQSIAISGNALDKIKVTGYNAIFTAGGSAGAATDRVLFNDSLTSTVQPGANGSGLGDATNSWDVYAYNSYFRQNINLYGASEFRYYNATNAQYAAFKYTGTSTATYTLPTGYPGGTGTSFLSSGTDGTMAWVAAPSGSSSGTTSLNVNVTGSATSNFEHRIIFTTASTTVAGAALSQNSTLSYNPSTDILSASGILVTSGLDSSSTITGALQVRGGIGATGVSFFQSVSIGSITGTGNAVINGNFQFKGIGTFGDVATSDTINVNARFSDTLAPSTNNAYDLGAVGFGATGPLMWKNIYAATGISAPILTGTATTATMVNVAITNTASVMYPVFSGAATTTTGTGLSSSSTLSYLPSTGTLTATAFSGYASTSRNVDVQLATTNAVHTVTFTPQLTAVVGSAISTDNVIVYNPSTKIITTSGLAVTALTETLSATTGALLVSGSAGIAKSLSVGTSVIFWNGANYSAFKTGSTANQTYTLPVGYPGAGTSVLSSDTAGTMTWVASGAVSGTVAVTNGGTGQVTYTDGQLLIGNSVGNTLTKATLTAGTNITISNGNGSITINATSSGSGAVNAGVANKIAYYPTSTTTVDDATGMEYLVSGTASTVRFYGGAAVGSTIFVVSTPSDLSIRVGIGVSNPQYELEINGELSATNKSFVINHPTKPGMKLRYGSLEGPENGVYVRGELKKSNIIIVPDHWYGLVDEDTYTVHLTPIGRYSQLYVVKIENYNVFIADNQMNPIHCYYSVWAERKDIPKLVTEY
jgi:hypothetical protein